MSDAVPLVHEAIEVDFQHPGAEPRAHERGCSSREEIIIVNVSTYSVDFTGCTFRPDPQRSYTFPELLSDVESGAEVRISGGERNNMVLERYPAIYVVGTGLVPPLLDESGGSFFIRNANGEVVVAEYYEGQ